MDSVRERSRIGVVWLLVILTGAAAALLGAWSLRAGSTSEPVPLDAMADPQDVYDPVQAGEELPSGYRPLLDRDQILPVYDPVFTSSSDVDWPAEMLVIGVAGSEEAKAYPVTHLNQREMVVDSLEGTPILVSW
jgi:hypothetical protein